MRLACVRQWDSVCGGSLGFGHENGCCAHILDLWQLLMLFAHFVVAVVVATAISGGGGVL